MSIAISIVEDDSRLRSSLERLLNRFEDCRVVSVHPNAEDALDRLPAVAPQVVLMDINLPGIDGIECVRRLRQEVTGTEFIILTVYEDSERIFEALAAGASGYLLKQAEISEIHAAIRQVSDGGAPMSSQVARRVVRTFRAESVRESATFQRLTVREREVLDLLAKGLLYKEIADGLDISYPTVNNHVRHIYRKLHVNSRSQAVVLYLKQPGARIQD